MFRIHSVALPLLLFCASGRAQQPALRLAAEATVQSENVTLADVLAPETNPVARLAARAIGLGRAPQPGSFRVYTAEQLNRVLPPAMQLESAATVVLRRPGWPLPVSLLEQAVRKSALVKDFDLAGARIIAPAGFTTAMPDVHLKLLKISRGSDPQTLTAEMRCLDRRACGRFAAQVILSQPVSKALSFSGARMTAGLQTAPKLFLVRSGKPASLVITAGAIRITETVTPLRSAQAGDLVRVMNPAARRVLLAKVIGRNLLRPADPGDSAARGGVQ